MLSGQTSLIANSTLKKGKTLSCINTELHVLVSRGPKKLTLPQMSVCHCHGKRLTRGLILEQRKICAIAAVSLYLLLLYILHKKVRRIQISFRECLLSPFILSSQCMWQSHEGQASNSTVYRPLTDVEAQCRVQKLPKHWKFPGAQDVSTFWNRCDSS